MNTDKIFYYIFTALLTAIFAFSATMYLTQYEMVSDFFAQLGFPTFIIYPLAIAKILALMAIWTRRSKILLEWAYAGLFFDAVLAQAAHVNAGHGWIGLSLLAIVFILLSRYFYSRAFKK